MPHDIVLHCNKVNRSFGSTNVLFNIDLEVARGQSIALVGSSGCGKSTLLNMIVGSMHTTSGPILIATQGGVREVDGHGPDRGMVFQKYAIYPHLTALENVTLGLMLNRTSMHSRLIGRFTGSWRTLRKQHLEQAERILIRLGLGDALHRYPEQLSGGMCQRVAVARALIMEPEVLLLDEPFGALDEETRDDARQLLRDLYAENILSIKRGEKPKYTLIMVTHSLEEAVSVGDRVIGLSKWWNWKEQGHAQFPGATIVYDKAAPVFTHEDEASAGRIMLQADELRHIVFAGRNHDPKTHCQFWNQVAAGEVEGVLK
jgi:NitT/TauT family transport system ATP-binding protein